MCFVLTIQAQHRVNSFYDEMGMMRLETQELAESADTLVTVFHRSDDVVWSRVVYRIIDMRFKQNYQLYAPVDDDPEYSSLFRVMLKAIADGMPVYRTIGQDKIVPDFHNGLMPLEDIPNRLDTDKGTPDADGNTVYLDPVKNIAVSEYMLLNYDSVTNKMTFNGMWFKEAVRNQLKYIIQEVVFFDRHYSRLYSKIMAIAPMHTPHNVETMTPMEALYNQILFWVPYDAFRPYMAQQYVTPRGNDSKRVTFDDFFSLKLYSSYLVGINNIYSRMIPEVAETYEDVQKEQQKIETELLKVEQDMWEY
jgi:gliding motility associated protien GldN